MRKKCASCGLIAFAETDICQRCGSNKLFKYALPQEAPFGSDLPKEKDLPFWSYPFCFVFACVFEFVALLPVLANIGWRHSANAPISDFERNSQYAAFILHLPSSALAYLFSFLDGGFLFLLVPFAQIIFLTFVFTKIWRRALGLTRKLK